MRIYVHLIRAGLKLRQKKHVAYILLLPSPINRTNVFENGKECVC